MRTQFGNIHQRYNSVDNNKTGRYKIAFFDLILVSKSDRVQEKLEPITVNNEVRFVVFVIFYQED